MLARNLEKTILKNNALYIPLKYPLYITLNYVLFILLNHPLYFALIRETVEGLSPARNLEKININCLASLLGVSIHLIKEFSTRGVEDFEGVIILNLGATFRDG